MAPLIRHKKIIIVTLYTVLLLAIGVQAFKTAQGYISHKSIDDIPTFTVTVSGNVQHPGEYKVPAGTSQFEILKVAGINATSDFTLYNLINQVTPNQQIKIDTLQSPVEVRPNVQLQFFLGQITVLSNDGTDRTPSEGLLLNDGDRILTEEKAQAEFSLNATSRMDMDNYAEVTFDKIGALVDKNKTTQLFQKNGLCWYQVSYKDPLEQHIIITPHAKIVVGGKGADFTVEVKYSEVIVNVLDGLILVERTDDSDAMNIIKGQSVVVSKENKPFAVSKMETDVTPSDRFSQLIKTKTETVLQNMPFNFLFCNLPSAFYLISVQFDRKIVYVINIPSRTSVRTLVYGFSTLQESLLYGKTSLTANLVERILNSRVSKYAVFDKFGIIRIASIVGGITVPVDEKAATYLKATGKEEKMKGQRLISYLNPAISGSTDSERRQVAVLNALFKMIASKNLLITALIADQALSNIDTDMNPTEVLKYYNLFMAKTNWSFKTLSLPVHPIQEGNNILYEPVLDQAGKLLAER